MLFLVLRHSCLAASYIYGLFLILVIDLTLFPPSHRYTSVLFGFRGLWKLSLVPCGFYFCYFYIKSSLFWDNSIIPTSLYLCHIFPNWPSSVVVTRSGHTVGKGSCRKHVCAWLRSQYSHSHSGWAVKCPSCIILPAEGAVKCRCSTVHTGHITQRNALWHAPFFLSWTGCHKMDNGTFILLQGKWGLSQTDTLSIIYSDVGYLEREYEGVNME